jgi:hypothetical protein
VTFHATGRNRKKRGRSKRASPKLKRLARDLWNNKTIPRSRCEILSGYALAAHAVDNPEKLQGSRLIYSQRPTHNKCAGHFHYLIGMKDILTVTDFVQPHARLKEDN